MKVYGIPNCTTVRKARAWLDQHGVEHAFVDFKKTAPSRTSLTRWVDALGWERVLNRRGTTWRGLDQALQQSVHDAPTAIAVMAMHPSTIKRPIVETGTDVLAGFDEAAWRERFGTGRSGEGR